jgi:hypothetical protein
MSKALLKIESVWPCEETKGVTKTRKVTELVNNRFRFDKILLGRVQFRFKMW